MTAYKIVQFSEDDKKIRLAPRALVDGYGEGDRFLEGVMFEVTVPGGQLCVKATEDAEGYLKHVFASVEKWEDRMLDYVKQAGDNLSLDTSEPGWDSSELHLTEDVSFYTNQGFVLDTEPFEAASSKRHDGTP